jgi:hypothetical protein
MIRSVVPQASSVTLKGTVMSAIRYTAVLVVLIAHRRVLWTGCEKHGTRSSWHIWTYARRTPDAAGTAVSGIIWTRAHLRIWSPTVPRPDRSLFSPNPDTYTATTKFVLHYDGVFVLQFPGLGDYRGGYTEANGVITFAWEGWSTAGDWGATGTLQGNSLTVRYNEVMWLTDFVDAAYVLT